MSSSNSTMRYFSVSPSVLSQLGHNVLNLRGLIAARGCRRGMTVGMAVCGTVDGVSLAAVRSRLRRGCRCCLKTAKHCLNLRGRRSAICTSLRAKMRQQLLQSGVVDAAHNACNVGLVNGWGLRNSLRREALSLERVGGRMGRRLASVRLTTVARVGLLRGRLVWRGCTGLLPEDELCRDFGLNVVIVFEHGLATRGLLENS